MLHRVNESGDGNYTKIEGVLNFYLEREKLSCGRSGFWLLKQRTDLGDVVRLRDRYSNDILEVLELYLNGRDVRGIDKTVSFECFSKTEFDEKAERRVAGIEKFFNVVVMEKFFDCSRNLATFMIVPLCKPDA